MTAADSRRRFRPGPGAWHNLMRVAWIGLALLAAAPAAAQLLPGRSAAAAEEQDPAPSEAAPAAAAFAIEQLPAELDRSRALVRRTLETARPRPDVEQIRRQTDAMAARIAAVDTLQPETLRSARDLRSLEAELAQVTAMRRTIGDWQSRLSRRSGQLAGAAAEIARHQESWRLTQQSFNAEAVPGEVLRSIEEVLNSLEGARTSVSRQQESVLALQAKFSGWVSLLDERLVAIQERFDQARSALFHAELPPIWGVGFSMPDFAASRDAWLAEWRSAQQYIYANSGAVWAHIGMLVFLLAGFWLLAGKLRRWVEQKPQIAQDLVVFQHPLASALLLTILAAPWFYPDAPQALDEALGLVLLLPLLRVMQLVVTPSLRQPVYAVAALYLLVRMSSLLSPGLEFQRYALLLLAAASAMVVFRVFRPSGPGGRLDAGRWWSTARLAARLSMLLLAAAIIANVGGLVALSGLLTNGVIVSAFIAIVLFAGVVVARSMFVALFQTRALQRFNMVRWHAATLERWIMRILPLAALVGWITAVARVFRVDSTLGSWLDALLHSSARIGTIEISLADVLSFGIAIWVGLLLSRFVRFMLEIDVFPRITLPRGVAATILMLVNYTVIGIAVVMAVAAAGIQLDRLAIIVGALSVGIGFGLTNVINNFVSGLILAFERPVQSGDTVEFGTMFGKVSRIGVRSSTVRTFDGAEVIVPNANLISNEVTNWTLSDMRRRIEILVGVAYGTDPHKVLELLLKVARSDERILADPEPTVLFLGFGDSSLDFSLRAWTDDFNEYLIIKSDLTLAVHDAIYAAGIEIPFPQRDLHLRSIDPAAVARIGPVEKAPVGADGNGGEQQAADAATQQESPPKPG
ncbi:mechanosensitive ion channel family protein [Thioalkalivibrio sp. XN279]|uniref:mechanosensitive ion channel family protein n=1 Tax=Thioalkalivibrio sp. XN279 TaxID=2714953 RepID=UPI0014095C8F|nr:mechanosensitive ion channel domain-containing protein [Thioalkalivibrio sp. XN279]NHA13469.1 mechanosensitive ion channel [Thioalkalivibrio sp. XN279]